MTTSSQHKGKRGELIVFGELLGRRAELYTPMVDIGVDAVVRGKQGTYVEIQIKATEAPNQDRYFNFEWEPSEDRFFVCVSLKDDPPTVWVIPGCEFDKYAQKQKAGAGHRWHLPLPQEIQGGPKGKTREELLDKYCASNPKVDAWRPLLPPE